jgi:hypothetical protein
MYQNLKTSYLEADPCRKKYLHPDPVTQVRRSLRGRKTDMGKNIG